MPNTTSIHMSLANVGHIARPNIKGAKASDLTLGAKKEQEYFETVLVTSTLEHEREMMIQN